MGLRWWSIFRIEFYWQTSGLDKLHYPLCPCVRHLAVALEMVNTYREKICFETIRFSFLKSSKYFLRSCRCTNYLKINVLKPENRTILGRMVCNKFMHFSIGILSYQFKNLLLVLLYKIVELKSGSQHSLFTVYMLFYGLFRFFRGENSF